MQTFSNNTSWCKNSIPCFLPASKDEALFVVTNDHEFSICFNVPASDWGGSSSTSLCIGTAECMSLEDAYRRPRCLKNYSQFHWSIRDPGIQGHLATPCSYPWDITLKLMPGLQKYNYLNFGLQCPFQFSINISISKSFLYQTEMKSIKCYRLCATQENHTLVPTVKLFET